MYKNKSMPLILIIFSSSHTVFFYSFLAGPFTQPVTSHMTLKNPTDKKILFKIKTTAPKKYCVRPNCGAIDPRSSVEIASKLLVVIQSGDKNREIVLLQSFPSVTNVTRRGLKLLYHEF